MKLLTILLVLFTLFSCRDNSRIVTAQSQYQYPVLPLIAADFSSDASHHALLSGKRLSVWRSDDHQLINQWQLEHSLGSQYLLSLAANHQVVATANKNFVTIFDVRQGDIIERWQVTGFSRQANISSLKLADNGDLVYLGLTDGSVVKVNLALKQRSLFKVHSARVSEIIPLADGERVLTAGHDGQVNLLDTSTGIVTNKAAARTRITSLALNRNANKFFYADALNTHSIVDFASAQEITSLSHIERFKFFRKALFIKDKLINSTPKYQLEIWQASSGRLMNSAHIAAQSFASTTLAMVTNGSGQLVTISSDGILEYWSV